MGGSFKLLGKGVAEQLISSTSNPFVGLLIGILSTVLVQSSSVTTSMVVALVSGGGLSVGNAVPIVMGANIGTTVTCAAVSVGHITRNEEFERAYAGANVHDLFNLLSVIVILPIQLATGFLDRAASVMASLFYGTAGGTFKSPVKMVVKPVVNGIHHFLSQNLMLSEKATGVLGIIIAVALIFTTLFFMVKFMRQMTATRLEHYIHRIFGANVYLTLVIGMTITAIIQASGITTSMIVPLLGAGLITLEQAFPLTVGANIGTTITALLASLAGNMAGLTIAFVHLLFNVCGTLIFFVPPFTRRIPLRIARFMAHTFVRHKKLVIIYIASVFFILPLLGILISSWL
jgi:sodium-dependent phosphate cotransporter